MKHGGIVVVTSGFPRRSETFALNELLALEARGLLDSIYATKPGDGAPPQPGSERLLHRLQVLPNLGPEDQAIFIAVQTEGRPVRGVHGYFAHTPTQVAAGAARRLGVPFSFGVHARDARKVTPAALAARAQDAACVVACNSDAAQTIRASGGSPTFLPHGVDIDRFRPAPLPPPGRLEILAVGRLVPKKGFDVLLESVTRLTVPFRLRIVGDGPERDRLATMVAERGLTNRVTLVGPATHATLPASYSDCHVLVVPSVVDQTGDRDGLPNVVLEGLASGRAVVASDVGGMAGAIVHETTGLMVPPGNVAALTAALETLAHSPSLREQLGRAGRERVELDFDLASCTARLGSVLEAAYG